MVPKLDYGTKTWRLLNHHSLHLNGTLLELPTCGLGASQSLPKAESFRVVTRRTPRGVGPGRRMRSSRIPQHALKPTARPDTYASLPKCENHIPSIHLNMILAVISSDLSMHLPIYLSIRPSICVYIYVYIYIYLCVCIYIYMSLNMCVYIYVYVCICVFCRCIYPLWPLGAGSGSC